MNSNLFTLDLNTQPDPSPFIPAEFPQVDSDYRVAFVGDFPGDTEFAEGRPFVGTSGSVLKNLLSQVGISPMAVMYSYVCGSKIRCDDDKTFPWLSHEVKDSLVRLKDDLQKFQPNVIVLLGNIPLHMAGKPGESITNWHGSLFKCNTIDSPCYGFKCFATYSPRQVFSMYEWMPLLRFDLTKVLDEGKTPELHLPERTYELNLTAYEIIEKLKGLPAGQPIALDIEGYVSWVSCLSIATSPHHAFIIPFGIFSPELDAKVIEQLRITFARTDLPKILQNCAYDYFVLAYRYQIHLANIIFDTMLSGWEIYPELPKGLGQQTAIWTREPYYKYQRKIDNTVTHWKYCCTDSCVTYEIAECHMRAMNTSQLEHFKFNMSLLPALNYIQLRGIAYDKERAQEIYQLSKAKQDEIQLRINIECGKSVNVNSPKQLSTILYKEKGYPPQHPKKGGRIDKTKLTTNIDALLDINRTHNAPLIRDLIAWRKCEKIQQMVSIPVSPKDGRIRCSYNIVGTDTGRLSCQASNEMAELTPANDDADSVGANLTTVTKKLRHLYRADPDYEFFQLDLAGADGWTVAAHCARLGDPTMLEDYHFGIKPARVIAYMYLKGSSVNSLDRADLHRLSKVIGSDEETEYLYFTCKRVQHGTNYLLGASTMSNQILKDSFKLTGSPIYVTPKMCTDLQHFYRLRYKGVKAWQNWVEQELRAKGKLGSASGHTRTFFGRRQANETLRSAVAHEPQHNTTYATNLALRNLWTDPENRRPDGSLIIEPLHHVHDAMCGQWPTSQRDWAITKLRTYFDNTLTIAGTPIRIPFEGAYGPSWGEANIPI
jgi:uracil-DNA glycosylase family 4